MMYVLSTGLKLCIDATSSAAHFKCLLVKFQLTGSLSSELSQLSRLYSIKLNRNYRFGGSIPSEIGLLKHLTEVRLDFTDIEGNIPQSLYRAKSLRYVSCSHTRISGAISTRIGLLTSLKEFNAAGTGISGTIPEALSKLSHLTIFHIEGNTNLTGSIPAGYCSKRIQQLATTSPEIVAVCTPSTSTGVPSVMCPDRCCTSCCDGETKVCNDQ